MPSDKVFPAEPTIPAQHTRPRLWSTVRAALFSQSAIATAIVGLLVSPMSISLGYYLGQRLNAAHTEVTQVFARFESRNPLDLPSQALGEMESLCPMDWNAMSTMLSAECNGLVQRFQINFSCSDQVKRGISRARQSGAQFSKMYDEDIKSIQEWKPGTSLNIRPVYLGGKAIEELVRLDKNAALNQMQNLRKTIDRCANLLTSIETAIGAVDDSRRTSLAVEFTAVVVNTGQADAVIYPWAELILPQSTVVPLVTQARYSEGFVGPNQLRIQNETGLYATVKGHSVANIATSPTNRKCRQRSPAYFARPLPQSRRFRWEFASSSTMVPFCRKYPFLNTDWYSVNGARNARDAT